MKQGYVRRIVVFGDHFKTFRKTLDKGALKKMYQVFVLIMTLKVVPIKFLRPIEGKKGLYEVRVEYESRMFRVFCCFDEGNLVVLFNGFQKKTQRTPPQQLDIAESLMRQYYEQKRL